MARGDLRPDLLEAQQGAMRVFDRLTVFGQHVHRMGLTCDAELQVQVRAVASCQIGGAGSCCHSRVRRNWSTGTFGDRR